MVQEVKTKRCPGIKLSLTRFSPNHVIDFHHHESPYFSFLVKGSYREKNEYRAEIIECGDMVVRPKDYQHHNQFSNEVGYTFKVELEQTYLLSLSDFSGNVQKDLDLRIIKSSKNKAFGLFYSFIQDEEWLQHESKLAEITHVVVHEKKESYTNNSLWMTRIKDYIQSNSHRKITLKELSDTVCINPVYMNRAFKTKHGFTIGDYQRQVKVNKAFERISSSMESLTKIAHDTGFFDQSHMIRCIINATGVSPLKIRKAVKRFV